MPSKRAARKPPPARPLPRSGERPAGPPGDDRVAQIQRVIEVMVQHGAVEVEMEEAGTRLRVRLKEERPPAAFAAPPHAGHQAGSAHAAPAAGPAVSAPASAPQGEVFKSPMLGTFYRSSSPEVEPFVKVGDRVAADTTLCIIEAMKVMNEIKAEREFEILDLLVRNGDPVEYGQPLFLIRN
jgi:acetyl-CoA carboxylase biotin carboxyl carrier protein